MKKDDTNIDDIIKKINLSYKTNLLNLTVDTEVKEDDNYIILTEAPNQNIFNWASKTYELSTGSINKMIQSGFHTEEEWESILFQLFICFYIMFKESFIFNNFSLDKNVFIKNIQTDTNNTGYWQYKINGIDFNVPNYGYLLTIDSGYNDITGIKDDYYISQDNQVHKFISSDLNDDKIKIKLHILKLMKQCFNRNNFSDEFKKADGISPPENILKIFDTIDSEIDKIRNELNKLNLNKLTNFNNNYTDPDIFNKLKNHDNDFFHIIFEIISKNDKFNYMNNRIGTLLTKNEEEMIIKADEAKNLSKKNNFNKGDLICYKLGMTTKYIFSIILDNLDDNKVKILTSENIIYDQNSKKNYSINEVNKSDLHYPLMLIEEQYKPGINYNKIEIYKINNE